MNCYFNPVQTIQGPGCLARLPELLHKLPQDQRRVLVIAWSEEALRHPVLAALLAPGGEFEGRSLVFTPSNPTVEQLFDTWESTRDFAPDVVIGVGGGGGNAVEHMIERSVQGVEFVCANTDAQALSRNAAPSKLSLGKIGPGACAQPEKGQEAAQAHRALEGRVTTGKVLLDLE